MNKFKTGDIVQIVKYPPGTNNYVPGINLGDIATIVGIEQGMWSDNSTDVYRIDLDYQGFAWKWDNFEYLPTEVETVTDEEFNMLLQE